jgi:arylsulfatase/uncharacterized sulfatase
MVPLLAGRADAIYRPDEAVGYELAGSAALYKGNYKLVKNIAPMGDGNWRLYDMAKDPGETQDLQQALPVLFAAMQADYAEYAKNNNVLPIPEGFDLHQAGLRYAVGHFFLPKLPALLAGLALLVGAVWWLRRRRAKALPA